MSNGNDKLNQWIEEYYEYRRTNPNLSLPTVHEPSEIPQKDQIIQQGKVFEKPRKKTRIVKIDELFSKYFQRKEEIRNKRRSRTTSERKSIYFRINRSSRI